MITGGVVHIVAVDNLGRGQFIEVLASTASIEAGQITDEVTPLEYADALALVIFASAFMCWIPLIDEQIGCI